MLASMKARLLIPVLALVLVAAGCSKGEDESPDPDASKGSASRIVEVSPVTGRTLKNGRPGNPVYVVKIENTGAGAPQIGLDKADLVVEELVEGGLTRLAAFYYSTLPSKVGHVRSMRGTDIGIAGPVGGQIVASGGAGGVVGKVKGAGIKVHTEDGGAKGFRSDPAKVRPYNRLVDLKRLDRTAKPSRIPGPYLPWSTKGEKKAGPQGRKVTRATVSFSGGTRTGWRLKDGTWRRTNGHASKEFRADNLLVLFAPVGDAGYTDPAGNPVPETKFRGSGRAVILHKDRAVEATWHKSTSKSEIVLRSRKGTKLTVAPGRTWIELVPKGQGGIDLG